MGVLKTSEKHFIKFSLAWEQQTDTESRVIIRRHLSELPGEAANYLNVRPRAELHPPHHFLRLSPLDKQERNNAANAQEEY